MATFERLTALDATFLGLEDGNAHMHVGGVLICEPGPLRLKDGRLDIDRIREAFASKLHLVPRYRQRLAYVPYEKHPVWIDDDRFHLEYHVRLTALPKPGGPKELKRLTGRVMAQMLDRTKPLWEIWVVDGCAEGRFALISKTHHCMIDGISGSDIISVLMDPDPNAPMTRPQPWKPRRAPHPVTLTADAVFRRLEEPVELFRTTRRAVFHPLDTMREAQTVVKSIADAIKPTLQPASETPLNVPIGPHRNFDWYDIPLDDVRGVKDALGGTVNDVVLATVAGALRRFFEYRRMHVDDLVIKAMVPVSVRTQEERGALGNRVSAMMCILPVHLADPIDRLMAVRHATRDLKESQSAVGAERLTAIADWTVPNLLVQAARLGARTRQFTLVVTNVPGPQIPLYLQGAEMIASYPVVPLAPNQALGVALWSYNGTLFWGFNACWDALPDLNKFARFVEEAFKELMAAAGLIDTEAEKAAAAKKPAKKPAARKRATKKKKAATKRAPSTATSEASRDAAEA